MIDTDYGLFDNEPMTGQSLPPQSPIDAWLATKAFKEESAAIYRYMWNALVKANPVLLNHRDQVAFLGTQSADQLFLLVMALNAGGKSYAPSYLKRVAQLIQRVILHRDSSNSAVHALMTQFVGEKVSTVNAMSPDLREEAGRYLASKAWALKQIFEQPELAAQELDNIIRDGDAWREIRDLAIFAVVMGAGLKQGEVVNLELADMKNRTTKIDFKIRGSRHREAPLASAFVPMLQVWVKIREAMAKKQGKEASGYLFVSTLSLGKVSKPTIFRTFRKIGKLLHSSDTLEVSSTIARHSYGVRQIERKHGAENVAKWMGLHSVATLAPYIKLAEQNERPD